LRRRSRDGAAFFVFSVIHSGGDMEHDDPSGREGNDTRTSGQRDPLDWETIKHDFIHGDWSLNRIAEARGASPTTIGRRAKREGWVRLVGTRTLRPGPKIRLPGMPRPKPKTLAQRRRAHMARRLLSVLDARLKEIEERMAKADASGEASSAEAERDMRSLSSIARIYAKLVELDEGARKSGVGQGSDKPTATRSDDADQLRRDLALRLERLSRAGDA
jgi:hypothetical protein